MNNKKLVLDSHKLQYHPRHVADFLEGKEVNPIYAEISPVAFCNHHCIFCNFNYLGHQGRFPDGRMISLVEELVEVGVKAIVFAGAGEPTMHQDTMSAIKRAKERGVDVAMSTNGALLKETDIETIVNNLTWIRFSFSGGSPENYAKIHKTKASDYAAVLTNIQKMKKLKDSIGSPLTIGTQFILIPENKDYVISQARIMKEKGANYFVVKHFYESDTNEFKVNSGFLTPEYLDSLQKAASDLSDENFSCIIRSVDNLDRNRQYNKCYGLPFIVYCREDGEVYTCFFHQHDQNTAIGNISARSFVDLWNSDGKKKALDYINNMIDKNTCQANCRHHQINNYLWDLVHNPPDHMNFI